MHITARLARATLAAATLLTLAGFRVAAQEPNVRPDTAPTLVYSVNRIPESPFETARDVTIISREEIERRDPRTIADLLMEYGAYVRQSMYSNSRVYLRAFNGKEILVLVDGVPANNTINTFELSLLDARMIERVEIVQGVGSVLGSEALGGIINVITRHGPVAGQQGPLHARTASRVGSTSAAGFAQAVGQTSRLRYHVGGSYTDSDDIRAGKGIGDFPYSGYVDRGVNGHLDYFLNADRTLSVSLRTHALIDPPRPQRYTSGTYARYVEPASQTLGSVRFADVSDYGWVESYQLTAFHDRTGSSINSIRASAPGVHSGSSSDVARSGLSLELASHAGRQRLLYGVDLSLEKVTSYIEDTTMATGAVARNRGRFTDGATNRMVAAYVQDQIALGERLVSTVGLRGAHFDTQGKESTSAGQFDIATTNEAVTASLNVLYRLSDAVRLAANVVDGFRAPDVEDLSTIARRSSTYEIPSPGLKPSRTRNYEVGVKYLRPGLVGSLFYQTSRGTDIIRTGPGTYRGLSFFDSNGNGIQDAGEPRVVQRKNLGEVTVSGATAAVAYAPLPSLHLAANYQYMLGRDKTAGTYLTRNPPAFGTARARWSPVAMTARPWIEAVYQTASAQHRLSADDLVDPFIGPEGTPGYDVVSLRSGITVLSHVKLRAQLENIGNVGYHTHGSQLPLGGREVVVGAELSF